MFLAKANDPDLDATLLELRLLTLRVLALAVLPLFSISLSLFLSPLTYEPLIEPLTFGNIVLSLSKL